MGVVLVREVPGKALEEIVTFGKDGSVSFQSSFLEKGMARLGIYIPEGLEQEYGGEGRIRLYKDAAKSEIHPFFQKAFTEIYVPQNIQGKGPGTVKWIKKD